MKLLPQLALLAILPFLAWTISCQQQLEDSDGVMDYTGYKVVRLLPKSADQVAILRKLEADFTLDYWNPPLEQDLRPVLTILSPTQEHFFLHALNRSHIGYEVVSANYQAMVDSEQAEMRQTRTRDGASYGPDYDYENSYHTYGEIVDQLKYLAATYPTVARYESAGTSYEGREIPVLIVGSGSQVIILEQGIHAREWVTVAFGTWVANYLIQNGGPLLSQYQFVVVPVLNVDGFAFTHTSNRLWRKTRSIISGSTCIGADPNRNWDSAFGQSGSSTNPCSETYAGPSPFSEPETRQFSQYLEKYRGRVAAYFAIHSYSQLWMWPWGYTSSLPPNAAKLESLSQAALAAIKATNGLDFVQGSIANAIYLSSGCSCDWVYDKLGVQIAFAIELRDKGQYGFQLPANQIRPAVYETWAGINAVIQGL